MNRFDAWDTLYSTFTYGCEILDHEFYVVTKVKDGWVHLQKLKRYERYEPEADGHIYFDTYHDVRPLEEYEGKPLKRKIKIEYDGTEYVDVGYYRVYANNRYAGKPMEIYNLH